MLQVQRPFVCGIRLAPSILSYISAHYNERSTWFVETIMLPDEYGTVDCTLHGPAMGDQPIADYDAFMGRRLGSAFDSRLTFRRTRQVRHLTVIGGPTQGSKAVTFYSVFGGPPRPLERNDPAISSPAELQASIDFWAEHALSR